MTPQQDLEQATKEIAMAFDEVAARFDLSPTDKLKIVGDLLHYYLDDLKT